MKELRLTFTDHEFAKLKKAKLSFKYASWHAFILAKCAKGFSVRHDKVKSVIPTLWVDGKNPNQFDEIKKAIKEIKK